jgi:ABC-2 type transport system permease protein
MSRLTGVSAMLWLALRRERVRIPVYVVLFTILVAETAAQSKSMFPTQAARADYAATVAGNPGLIAMVGPPYAVTNVGGDVAWQLGGFGAAFVALMSMFMVGRHTRGEEQSGRSELVLAAPVAREAPVTAALIVVVATQVLLGAAVALTMIGFDQPAAGSLALGASLTGVGLVFAGLSACAAQISETSSAMYGIVGAAIGGAYLLRAAGDVGDGTLSWLSPIGWGQRMRPFAGERWWPLALSLTTTVALVGGAFALRARRDEGAGLVGSRPGPASASKRLTTPLGLALRLQRGLLLGWSAGLFFSGLSIGLTGATRRPSSAATTSSARSSAPRAATSSTSTSPSRCSRSR